MTAAKWLMLAIQASIFLTVVAVGLGARFRDAVSLFRRPRALSRALLSMYVVMPALALLLALALDLRPVIAVALVAVSLAPVPPLLPRKTSRAGGDATYVVALLATAALLSVVLIPLGLRVVSAITATEAHVDMMRVVRTVLLSVLLPLVVGMTIRWRSPRLAARAMRPIRAVATFVLAATVPLLLVSAWPAIPGLVGDGTLFAMVVFVAVGLAVGHFVGGPDPAERAVLALASGARHPGIAVALGTANVADPKLMMAAVVLYLLVAALVAVPYMVLFKRRHPLAGRALQP
jgi:bile acid:Na+ symporter, BASS family